MPEHTHPGGPTLVNAEPASVSEIARLIVAVLVTIGVLEVDDLTLNSITLALGGLISIGLTWWTRRKSTPIAQPRGEDGRPLVPAPTRPGDDPAL